MFGPYSDYLVPLLTILNDLPTRMGRGEDILVLFEAKYREQIPAQAYRREAKSGKIHWVQCIYNIKQMANSLGLVDSPSRGLWRLTEVGRQWLQDNPNATRYISGPVKGAQTTNSRLSPAKANAASPTFPAVYDSKTLLQNLQVTLEQSLKPIFGSTHYSFIQRANFLQIRMDGFSGCHYEIILRRHVHEIALHFESSPEICQARLQTFEPHLERLSQFLKSPVKAGDRSRGWTQVKIERRAHIPLSSSLAGQYATMVIRFIEATFPILIQAYQGRQASRRKRAPKETQTSGLVSDILEREISAIRAYLAGQSDQQPSDEKLCDWIHFCYTFELYSEGKDLFSLVSPDSVYPWYYDKTKRIAKICEIRRNRSSE